ncbi:MFS general substrate transporter [Mycena vulgaris]|nr:MFS general substrate transporter [Mycena vulgaris]
MPTDDEHTPENPTPTSAMNDGGAADPEPYSIYTPREKWSIVALIALGGLFSPLSSNIYFPVIPPLSGVFHKSIELINLTVTMYIVFQGLAPMFWGTLADSLGMGRRPMFICCLLLLSASCIGLALIPTSAYWLLLFMRCGVIGDISERAERGGFFGVYNIGPKAGPTIGPVLGGALSESLGWRSTFWFLCIASSACAVVLILFLPETLRSMVGNGSIPASPLSRPVILVVGRGNPPGAGAPLPRKSFQNPLRLLLNADILILLGFNGLVCAVFYGVNASVSTLLHAAYPALSETQLGLCFLAIGSGMLVGSATSGKILDWDYQRVKRSLLAEKPVHAQDDSFPIEKARMRLMPALLACYAACCAAYGWCIERDVSLVGPLLLLIGVGFFSMALMNAVQTLILDLVPGQGSSDNLGRCALSAAMVACIELVLAALGAGWTYVLLARVCVVASPLIYVVMRIGPACRARRRALR